MRTRSALSIVALALGACQSRVLPAAKAARVEERVCARSAGPDDLAMLEGADVRNVRGMYYRDTCAGVAQVYGTRLSVRPSQGVVVERMESAIRCHGARALLGEERSLAPADPYWVPDGWVDVDVEPKAGDYEVTLMADSVANNIVILRRAVALAAVHRDARSSHR